MKFENTQVTGIDTAIRSMRMPLQSFDKSDSNGFLIGERDLDLCHRLLSGNDADAKFLRSIHVYTEITAPCYWLAELDTYKISTVRNSSSIQHTGAKRDYDIGDFTQDAVNYADLNSRQREILDRVDHDWMQWLKDINSLRQEYKETNDYRWFRIMRQMIPMSYNYVISWTANYQVLRTIWKQRIKQKHRLVEWELFGDWISKLPYANDLIFYEGVKKNGERI